MDCAIAPPGLDKDEVNKCVQEHLSIIAVNCSPDTAMESKPAGATSGRARVRTWITNDKGSPSLECNCTGVEIGGQFPHQRLAASILFRHQFVQGDLAATLVETQDTSVSPVLEHAHDERSLGGRENPRNHLRDPFI